MLTCNQQWIRGLIGVILVVLVVGCSPTSNEIEDPYTQVEGTYRIQLTTNPTSLRVGQPATLIATIQDTASGDAPTDVVVRPILDMDMSNGMGMTISNLDTQEVEPGLFHINTIIDHAGDITLALTLDTPDGLVSVRFPPMTVLP